MTFSLYHRPICHRFRCICIFFLLLSLLKGKVPQDRGLVRREILDIVVAPTVAEFFNMGWLTLAPRTLLAVHYVVFALLPYFRFMSWCSMVLQRRFGIRVFPLTLGLAVFVVLLVVMILLERVGIVAI